MTAIRKIVFVEERVLAEAGQAAARPIHSRRRHRGDRQSVRRHGLCRGPVRPVRRRREARRDSSCRTWCGGSRNPAVSYGKAAIVGVAGDFEHGGALIHPKLGKPMRAAVGGGEAIISSNVKVAPAGTAIDVPLAHKDDIWSFDHFDTMTVMVADAPRPDEIAVIMIAADGGRPSPRLGKGRVL